MYNEAYQQKIDINYIPKNLGFSDIYMVSYIDLRLLYNESLLVTIY